MNEIANLDYIEHGGYSAIKILDSEYTLLGSKFLLSI